MPGQSAERPPPPLTYPAQSFTGGREFVGATYDWRHTSASGLAVSVWVNNSNVGREVGPPEVQRWNQPLNLAANAFLKLLKVPWGGGGWVGGSSGCVGGSVSELTVSWEQCIGGRAGR